MKKVKSVRIQVQKFIELCEATGYTLTLKEVSPELFEITSLQNYNKLYIKILPATRRGYLNDSDINILEEAREEYHFSFWAYGADDAFNCVLAYLEDRIYFDSTVQSLYWKRQYFVGGDNNEERSTKTPFKKIRRRSV